MSETECLFVSSRGILKSCTFHSSAPKSSCNNDVGYLIQMVESGQMFDGMSIYVCSDLLCFFIYYILPKVTHPFILVTGDSDATMPFDLLSSAEFERFVNHPYLLRMFSQNMPAAMHPKMVPLPIGLDYHTIASNPSHPWQGSKSGIRNAPKEQEAELLSVVQFAPLFYDRQPRIFMHFTLSNDRFKSRSNAMHRVPAELRDTAQAFMPRKELWQKMAQYAFVLSPYGMGLDCHRTWEALCLGCIPIVLDGAFSDLFSDLPVLKVRDWGDVTAELLDETIQKLKGATFNRNKLHLSYWTDRIRDAL